MFSLLVLFPLGLLALTFIVVIHELGHFIAAKRSGVFVEEFGVGLPPRIWGKRIGETLYSINALPLGGFVKLHGETMEEKTSDPKRSFSNKAGLTRAFIALAGIFMNFVLAFVCFTIVYSIEGVQTLKETEIVKITNISTNSPAQVAGMLVEDVIKTANGKDIKTPSEFISLVNENKGKRVKIIIERKIGESVEEKVFSVTPRENPPENEGALGVAISNVVVETYYPPLWKRPIVGVSLGLQNTIAFTKEVLGGFAQISKDVSAGKAPVGFVGPVGILAVFAEVLKRGFVDMFNFIGIVSLNLALFNLIPFPPLDGSRVVFVLIEKIIGKRFLPRIEAIAHSTGMILLIILMLFITGREIPKLINSSSLSGFVDSLAPTED